MARPRRSTREQEQEASRDRRLERARTLWAETEHAAEPPFDLDAAKARLLDLDSQAATLTRSLRDVHREQGDLLRRIKKEVGHGNFLPWITQNVEWSERKIRYLMKHSILCESAEALGKDLPEYRPEIGSGCRFGGANSPQDCRTPENVITAARLTLGGTIDLDPATSKEQNDAIVHATTFFTEQDNGLDRPWHGTAWVNPPWNNAERFTAKLVAEHQAGRVKAAILLVNGLSMLAKWWIPIWSQPLCLARVPFFIPARGKTEPTTPIAAIAYFGPDEARFFKHFYRVGMIIRQSTLGYDPVYDEYDDATLREATFPDEEE